MLALVAKVEIRPKTQGYLVLTDRVKRSLRCFSPIENFLARVLFIL